MRRVLHAGVAAFVVACGVTAAGQSNERVDTEAFTQIRDEGLQHSQVMDTLSYLTDVYGARLTNSPQMRDAATWAVARLKEWRIDTARTESWGPFGRGWSNERLTANVIAPVPWPLIAIPKAWTRGTEGTVAADAILIDDDTYETWAGKLRGRIVLSKRAPAVTPQTEAPGRRLSNEELARLEQQPPSSGTANAAAGGEFARRQMRFFAREGVVAVLEPGPGVGDRGSVLVMGQEDDRKPDAPPSVTQLVLASEHYGRLVRMLERKAPVRIELNVQNRFYDQPQDSLNILAEIPGASDAGEVVMLGAHFDSWHAGTGATDNAVGVAIVMEAMRILKARDLRLRRTVRLALWTGEEQGLLGSRAYVARHFANRETMPLRSALKPAHEKLSVYFNLDNGTGAIRGVYTEGNTAVRPIFKAWMAPLADLGIDMTTARGTGDTDHISFDEVGLPGFQFVQDPIDYYTLSHHSNMDLYERVQPDDVKQNAVIVASFVYQAANRDGLLPRKPLPARHSTR